MTAATDRIEETPAATLGARFDPAAAEQGMSVLLLSSDADEVVTVAHRAVVFADGRPKCELSRDELTPLRLAKEWYGG